MLLRINEFANPIEIFSSRILFKNERKTDNYEEKLLKRYWKETCYVYEL